MKRLLLFAGGFYSLLLGTTLGAQGSCDSAFVAFTRIQTDSARKAHTSPATQAGVTLYQRRSLARIDSAAQRRCLTPPVVVPPPTTNQPPVARFTYTCTVASPTIFGCTLNGSTSTDSDGTIASYAWKVPGKADRAGVIADYAGVAGTYQATLTVTDDKGATHVVTLPVTMGPPAPPVVPPVTPPVVPPIVPPVTPPPSGAVPSIAPTLPQATVDVSWPTITRSLTIAAGGNLQAALDSARRGDEIVCSAGATYTGNFTLPPKAGTTANGWIVVRPSALAQLPPLGTRIDTLVDPPKMCKLITPNVLAALQTLYGQAGVSGWRIAGLELTVSPAITGLPNQQGIVIFGTNDPVQNTAAKSPRDLILDRVYIHGTDLTNTVRCVDADAIAVAVVHSVLTNCHGKGFDSQAIAADNGLGPFLIENNHLEAAGEVIIFGGAIAAIPNLVASDITIRRNHLTRPLSWKGVWTVKNLFELKNAQRVLVEANVMENHWVDAQAGAAIVLGTADNPCSWCIVSDVTFEWNHIHHVASGFNLFPNYGNAQPMRRVKIANNLVTGVGASGLGMAGNTSGKLIIAQDNLDDLWVEHNTWFAPTTYVDIGDESTKRKARFTFRNNIGGGAQFMWFSGQGMGDAATAANLTAPFSLSGNCFVAPASAQLPSGNLPPVASLAAVGFVNPVWPGGNWSLGAGSPCAGAGVDFGQLLVKLAGVR